MRVPSRQQAMQEVAERLAELVNVDQNEIRLEADGVVETGPFTFAVEWKGAGIAGPVAAAIAQVRRHDDIRGAVVPLVAVPYMGDAGRKRCTEADVAWIDLSGNARIFAPGLRSLI